MITPESLRVFESLRDYSPRELEVLLGAARACRFAAGAALCEEGRPGSSCFFLVAGEVAILRAAPVAVLSLGGMKGKRPEVI